MAEEDNERAQNNGQNDEQSQNNNAQDNSSQNSGGQGQEDKGNDSQGSTREKLTCPYCGGLLTPESNATKFGGPLYKAAWDGIYNFAFMTRRTRYLCLNPKCQWGYYPRTRVRFVKGLAYISKNSIFEEHLLNDAIRRSHRQRKTLGQRIKEKIAVAGSGAALGEREARLDAQGDGAYHGSNPLAATGGPQNYNSQNGQNGQDYGQGYSGGGQGYQGYNDSEDDGAYRGEMGGYDADYDDEEDGQDDEEQNSGQASTSRANKIRRS